MSRMYPWISQSRNPANRHDKSRVDRRPEPGHKIGRWPSETTAALDASRVRTRTELWRSRLSPASSIKLILDTWSSSALPIICSRGEAGPAGDDTGNGDRSWTARHLPSRRHNRRLAQSEPPRQQTGGAGVTPGLGIHFSRRVTFRRGVHRECRGFFCGRGYVRCGPALGQ